MLSKKKIKTHNQRGRNVPNEGGGSGRKGEGVKTKSLENHPSLSLLSQRPYVQKEHAAKRKKMPSKKSGWLIQKSSEK